MLCKFSINYTKISSHGLIRKHNQFILNPLQNTFSQQKFRDTIHMNSATLAIRIFSIRFKAFEIEFTAKTSLRTFLTIYMALSQRLTQVGKDLYLLELSELHQMVPMRSPRRVEQLCFLLRRELTVRMAENLERRCSLSLKITKPKPLHLPFSLCMLFWSFN